MTDATTNYRWSSADVGLAALLAFLIAVLVFLFLLVVFTSMDNAKIRNAVSDITASSHEFLSTKEIAVLTEERVDLSIFTGGIETEKSVDRILAEDYEAGIVEYRAVEGGQYYWGRFWRKRTQPIRP